MNDRELLEAAARAAGLYSQGPVISGLGGFMGLSIREDNYPGGYCWNPLTDDGDALRLAVKLGIAIYPPDPEGSGATAHWLTEEGAAPYAATRRAIVRAAAAMAKKKP